MSESETRYVVALVGEIPHILEEGSPSVDMRDTLLGPNVPVVPMGQKGKHLTSNKQFFRAIPLRHTTPGSGKVTGQSMGSAYDSNNAVSDSKKLGRQVYNAAKALSATRTDPYGKTLWGGRLDTSGMQGGKGVPLLKPHHKSSIYEGMIRNEKTYEKSTQSSYVTFRTISTAVRDESWWRKPIEARHYASAVADFAGKTLSEAIAAYLGG